MFIYYIVVGAFCVLFLFINELGLVNFKMNRYPADCVNDSDILELIDDGLPLDNDVFTDSEDDEADLVENVSSSEVTNRKYFPSTFDQIFVDEVLKTIQNAHEDTVDRPHITESAENSTGSEGNPSQPSTFETDSLVDKPQEN